MITRTTHDTAAQMDGRGTAEAWGGVGRDVGSGMGARVPVRRIARRHGAPAVVTALVVLVMIRLSGAAAAVPGAVLWTARYNGPANGVDSSPRVAVNPDG